MVNARSKGRRGELECIQQIEQLLGIKLEVNYSQSFGGGHDLLGCPGYAIEVKRRRAVSQADLKNWWDQAVKQALKVDLLPCLWFRADRADWRVAIPDVYAHKNNLFPIEDFNIASVMSTELWAAIMREEYNIGTREISTE